MGTRLRRIARSCRCNDRMQSGRVRPGFAEVREDERRRAVPRRNGWPGAYHAGARRLRHWLLRIGKRPSKQTLDRRTKQLRYLSRNSVPEAQRIRSGWRHTWLRQSKGNLLLIVLFGSLSKRAPFAMRATNTFLGRRRRRVVSSVKRCQGSVMTLPAKVSSHPPARGVILTPLGLRRSCFAFGEPMTLSTRSASFEP